MGGERNPRIIPLQPPLERLRCTQILANDLNFGFDPPKSPFTRGTLRSFPPFPRGVRGDSDSCVYTVALELTFRRLGSLLGYFINDPKILML
jgi:hypothetical protein